MKISKPLSDRSILAEIGSRIARTRLDQQLSQAKLAEQAGVAKRTVERIEAGASAQMSSMIRILRVLGLLANLDQLIPATRPSPIDMLKRKGQMRQRASSSRGTLSGADKISGKADNTSELSEDGAAKPWSWDDDV